MRGLRSIQARLLALLAAGGSVVLLAAGVSMAQGLRHELDELLDAHLAQAAALLVVQEAGEPEHGGERTLDAPSLHRYAAHAVIQVFDDGVLVLRSADAPLEPLLPLRAAPERHGATRAASAASGASAAVARSASAAVAWSGSAPAPAPVARSAERDGSGDDRDDGADDRRTRDIRAAGALFRDVTVGGTRWRVFAAASVDRHLQVYVGERVDARDEILRGALWGALWPLALALPVLGAIGWWSIRRGLAPLHALGRDLAQRPAHARAPLVRDARTPSEVTPLLDALDGLLARIDAMVHGERRFTADAAHELRTPIAAIRMQAQVALGATDDTERRHALAATLAGCDRASRLVEQLLTLSRLESGAAVLRQPVELGDIARTVVGDLRPRAVARGQALAFDAAGQMPLDGEPTLLAILVRNLVDNALRYSPDGARIAVRVGPDAGGEPALTVEDDGPGLAAAAIEQLGRRFHRGSAASGSGSGLGWSIVQRIAQAHGLLPSATASATGGLAVEVRRAAPGTASLP